MEVVLTRKVEREVQAVPIRQRGNHMEENNIKKIFVISDNVDSFLSSCFYLPLLALEKFKLFHAPFVYIISCGFKSLANICVDFKSTEKSTWFDININSTRPLFRKLRQYLSTSKKERTLFTVFPRM